MTEGSRGGPTHLAVICFKKEPEEAYNYEEAVGDDLPGETKMSLSKKYKEGGR